MKLFEISIADDWQVKPLRKVCSLVTDGAHLSPTPQEEGEIIANVKDMRSWEIDYDSCTRIDKQIFSALVRQNCSPQKDDVLLSKDGTIGRVILFDGSRKIVLLSSIAILRSGEEIEPAFLKYVLSSFFFEKQLFSLQSGSALKRITVRDINRLQVPFPDKSHQQKIAKILTTIDRLIEKTEALIAKYQDIKQGMMHDLFTRGINENGHLRPPYEQAPELYQESAISWIPKEWNLSLVDAECNISTGFTLGIHRRPVKNRRKYLRVANVHRDRILLDDVAEIEARDEEFIRKKLEKGDLLIVEGHADPQQIGRCAMVGKDAAGLTFQNHLFRLKPTKLDPSFLNDWLNSYTARQYWLIHCGTSSGLNTINQKMLRTMPVVVPEFKEQIRIEKAIKQHKDLIRSEIDMLSKLEAQKTGLMQDLLTGKVRVNTPATPTAA